MFSKIVLGVASLSASLAIASSASAADTRMVVVNSTNHTLVNVYASRISDPHYHGDWLGDRELAPGQSTVIDFDDGAGDCLMDVKGVFSDNTYVHIQANVCTDDTVTFTGN